MKFYGKQIDGETKIFDRQGMEVYLKSLEGKNFCIAIDEHGTYSDSQWGYLHALLTIFTKELNKLGNNFTTEKVKDMLRMKCPELRESNYISGVYVGDSLKSTKSLTKEEMANVIETLKAWGDEFSIYLPEAREQMKIV